jgi:Predicted membrane protein (DUF2306)
MSASKSASRLLWFAIIFLIIIGVAAVTRRSLVLLWPQRFGGGGANPAAALDSGFARHVALTFVHILPGALFLVLAAFQFSRRFRQRHLQLHRWSGRALVVCGLIIGVSALIMSFKMNIGDRVPDLSHESVSVHSPQGCPASSGMDDSSIRSWPGRGHDAADCRDVLRVSPAHAARIFWHRLLAGIHDYVPCQRGVDRLHPASQDAG